METWPEWKTLRIERLLLSLGLPEQGDALDWGCGAGVFTDVLARALPAWRVVGSDLSPVALAKARERVPRAEFVAANDISRRGACFDLVFTHHVLEHVGDLSTAWAQLASATKVGGLMLHVLPCGDPGSLERSICGLREDGVDPTRGGRFFFEDPAHLRRLTTAEMDALAAAHGFVRERAWYANQRLGAIEWITASGTDFVRTLTATERARSFRDRIALGMLRGALLPLAKLRAQRHRRLAGTLMRPLERAFERLGEHEWARRKDEPGGSEMYLVYRRDRSS